MIKGPIPKIKHGKSISRDKPGLKDRKCTKFKTEFTNLSIKTDTYFFCEDNRDFNWGGSGANTLSIL